MFFDRRTYELDAFLVKQQDAALLEIHSISDAKFSGSVKNSTVIRIIFLDRAASEKVEATTILTSQFLHPEASFFPSGDQAIANTQCVCP